MDEIHLFLNGLRTRIKFIKPHQPRINPRIFISAVLIALVMTLVIVLAVARAEGIPDNLAVRAIIGEAGNQGYQGMLAVAVGIRNRGTLQGVYGVKAKHVDREPQWGWDIARKAWQESAYNRIHSGTHWENIKAFGTPYWVKNMVKVYEYKSHVFYRSK